MLTTDGEEKIPEGEAKAHYKGKKELVHTCHLTLCKPKHSVVTCFKC